MYSAYGMVVFTMLPPLMIHVYGVYCIVYSSAHESMMHHMPVYMYIYGCHQHISKEAHSLIQAQYHSDTGKRRLPSYTQPK